MYLINPFKELFLLFYMIFYFTYFWSLLLSSSFDFALLIFLIELIECLAHFFFTLFPVKFPFKHCLNCVPSISTCAISIALHFKYLMNFPIVSSH